MCVYVLDNATLWIGDGRVLSGYLTVAGGRIEAVGEGRYRGELPVTDLAGMVLSPGLVDLMVLGALGRSVLRDDAVELGREYLKLGVTTCQLCVGTLPADSIEQVANNAGKATAYAGTDAARVAGLYLEGPFQQPDLTGGSMRQHALPATKENVQRILDLGPAVTMINVSPGLENDTGAIRRFREAGKIVSMAHSNAPADRVLACIEAGTSVLGHVWDNNSGLIGDSGVQQPTLEHVALQDERVRFIHGICDGTHVHPLMIRLVLRCRGVEAVCLVTDANIRSGCPDGEFVSDDGRRFRKQGGVIRTDAGWLTGSALLLPDMFRNFVKFTGLPPHEAIRTVTLNPATCLGRADEFGLLAPGRCADLVAWDDQLRIRRVWRAGDELESVSNCTEVRL
ncbi:MAG: N-acetylglucosamine-6-phosphate deacetylase [Phycisphaerae bacterium]